MAKDKTPKATQEPINEVQEAPAETPKETKTKGSELVGKVVLIYKDIKVAELLGDDSIIGDNGEVIRADSILRSAMSLYKENLEIIKVTDKNLAETKKKLEGVSHSIKG